MAGGDTTAAAAAGDATAAAGDATAAAGGATAAAGDATAAAGDATAAAGDATTAAAGDAAATPAADAAAASETPAALMMAPESELGQNTDTKRAPRIAQKRNKVTNSKKRSKLEAKGKPVDLKSQLRGAAGIRNGRTHKGTQNKNKAKPQVSKVGNKIHVNLGNLKKNKENKQGKNEKIMQFGHEKLNLF
jgi:hypothetical protein